jgi:AcrR family transcriptional regulator
VPRQTAARKLRRRERGSLNPDEIMAAAFELAEQVSIDNFSMPVLAKQLGISVTSIYWYFRKKEDLLNAMTDRARRQVVFDAPYVEASRWRESLRNHALNVRKTFLSSPVLCDLVLIRGALSAEARRLGVEGIEQAIGALVEAGFRPEDAYDIYSTVSLHVRGSIVLARLDQKIRDSGTGTHAVETWVDDLRAAPMMAKITAKGHRFGVANDNNFEYGLDCILDRAERLLEERTTAANGRRPTTGRAKSTTARSKSTAARATTNTARATGVKTSGPRRRNAVG